MKIIKVLVLFICMIFVNTHVILASEWDIQDLVVACDAEINEKESDGSCLILGIVALKAKYFQLHQKIEFMCMEQVKKGLLLNSTYYEAFLSYYPKCNYIYTESLKTKESIFDSKIELKTLVRFLNK